ncbi:DUF4238 domain-containing protein [Legionella pneumophila]|uniref:DUF4238 domain-containing protein n=1 Tax=Legionella pneumophila TaxID=446 RepID=UPI00101EFC54|nr:DUF4238 domain-containing protein [Legionella pneumophila]RYW83743.1 DUF4238 domain-containing protein [Legionella pneumophila]HCD9498742.1 DUF4238 domain-containing protein [Legionella pneumophila]
MHQDLNSYDHYVAQTYLRHFSCYKNHVFVYRKKTRAKRSKGPEKIKKICGEQGWDICQHLENVYALREFLNVIEPAWNLFIQSIKDETLHEIETHEENELPVIMKGVLYIAYLRLLSPRSIEMAQKLREGIANRLLAIQVDKIDDLTPNQRQLIKDGKIQVQFNDPVYFKGFSLNHLYDVSKYIYSRNWDILINNTKTKFITSDNPVIFKNFYMKQGQIMQIDNQFMPLYIPLTPYVGLIIRKEAGTQISYKEALEEEVNILNEEMVKFATDLVVSSDNKEEPNISTWVDKYKDTSLSVVFNEINLGYQKIITMQQKPVIEV